MSRRPSTAQALSAAAAMTMVVLGCSSGATGQGGGSVGTRGRDSGTSSSGTTGSSGSGSGSSSSGGGSGSGGGGPDAGNTGESGWGCADNGANCLCYDPAPSDYTLATCPSYACCWADLTDPAEHDCECLNESPPCANPNPNPNAVAVAHCPP